MTSQITSARSAGRDRYRTTSAFAARSANSGGMILDRLRQVLLLQVLRDHVADDDPQLGPAFKAMSRSTFFLRFRENTGMTPLDHLHRLRMRHAARPLRDTTRTVASIAIATGYRTESAFGAAFRRFAGRSPGEYRTGIVT
ncbi:helix-turn-helix transcriptional regulator [Lentzea sp. BCCO 10_0798]|uniref:Helix-turn-helix transcriptional regulator n=1 Tax=Lentzea kristufekii TaxID=3095430 RepID=A0ABU4TL63_9PSEU|nr:helix-turn-helix transcriptional regulator [Lentzea sp. BCCO 10_0798]MDX8048977.1 helix-turn-helix transcriptional regulator [Lentzea sp. BCCO 10_0798]